MATSLGIDVGATSIGWCLVGKDGVIDLGVRIFPSGRDVKSGASLAVDRRDARAARRRRDRYIRRRSVFLETLVELGMMPADADEARMLAARDPYALRMRALDDALTPYEVGRALFHLNQRRGFKSNRKADRARADGEDGKIEGGAKALDAAMLEASARTLGEFLAGRTARRVRMGGENQTYDFYPQRRHVEAEFTAIWIAQAPRHPAVLTEAARERLHRILFFQRPLKAPEVGRCTFAGMNGVPEDEQRLAKAHPLFQQRRLYEEVNHLRIVSPGAADRPLSPGQRDALILKLRDKKKVSFISLAKVAKLGDGERFNKESDRRKDLLGDEVRAEMADKSRFGTRWSAFDLAEQLRIIDQIQNEEDPDALLDWLVREYGLDAAQGLAVARARLPEGYGRFGETATRRLLEFLTMNSDVVTYDQAAAMAGFHHSDHRTGENFDRLPYYGELLTREIAPGRDDYGDDLERQFGKITNPTVHIGLRQLQQVVNGVVTAHGKPDRIVVELARELKLNEQEKAEHERRIRRDTAAAEARSRKLSEEGLSDTGGNRMLLRLWEDLNPGNPLDRRCPYCGEVIGIR